MPRPLALVLFALIALAALPAAALDANVSEPALMKIEDVALSTTCPAGWRVRDGEATDGSFVCDAIPDTYAPTNLIHCLNGLKYFARSGRIGCRNPAVPFEDPAPTVRKTKTAAPATPGVKVGSASAKAKSAP